MIWLIVCLIGFQIIGTQKVQAVRCFECNHYPSPELCMDTTTCTTDQDCYVEEVVTTGGLIVYNSGCVSRGRCSVLTNTPLVGKRNADIITCQHCCQGDLCNNAGCSKTAIPRNQRGPYCFSCDLISKQGDCDKLTICDTDQQCLLHIPPEYQLYPVPLYRAECESKDACASLRTSVGRCPAICCDTDFCNDHCFNGTATISNTPSTLTTLTTTTARPTTTKSTTTKSTTTTQKTTKTSTTTTRKPTTTSKATTKMAPNQGIHCRSPFHRLPDTNLCIDVHVQRKNWEDARQDFWHDGGDLIIYKTDKERQALLKYLLATVGKGHGDDFWIGMYDRNDDDHFEFVNGDRIHYKMWLNGQPDKSIEDCVRLEISQQARWANRECFREFPYICQKI